ncbi:MAG TPA: ATP-binding cassette domain-containing protein, partial [Candidatus Bathyarchaeia archaeon]|nr:ATP-binding cassette domain-containing protein [Candidatus Bathyarchaeia archaeon]
MSAAAAAGAAAGRPERDRTVACIDVGGLSCRYQDAARSSLEGVDLRVGPGQIVAVMGASGAGKSTLLKCLTGIVPGFEKAAVGGEGRVLELRLDALAPGGLAGRVGMVFQDFEAQLFSTNVALEVGFALDQMGHERAEIHARTAAALDAVGLAGFAARDPATLSGGEKQRLAMAAVLALDPEVVLLDEPTTDIDPLGKAAIFALLRAFAARGAAVVVVEHETRAAEVADRLVILSEGRVAGTGESRELLRDTELLERSGVRPRDLDKLAQALGIERGLDSLDEAETLLCERGWIPSAEGLEPDAGPVRLGEPLLELRDVRHVYPGGTVALDGVSLDIAPGEFVALIGQNGS